MGSWGSEDFPWTNPLNQSLVMDWEKQVTKLMQQCLVQDILDTQTIYSLIAKTPDFAWLHTRISTATSN